jgi:pyruvate,water dikinase
MIKERTIAHKPVMSHITATGVKVTPVPDHLQDQPVLDDDHLLTLCTLGKKVEAFFGCPQNIEWGMVTDFVILQARPITVKEPIVWSRANAAETIPGYITYLSRVPEDRPDYIVLGLTPLLACFGIKDVEHLKVTEYLYGHVYLNMSVARSVVGQIPGLSPDVLYQSLGHTSDEEVRPALTVSDMIKLAPGTVRVIQFFLQLPKRAKEVIPHSLTLLEDIRHKKKELQTLTLEELDTLIWDVYERNSQVFQVHTVTALAVFGLFGIVQRMVAHVGEQGMETMLTMGLTGMSSSQLGVEMWKLAQCASQLSAVSDVILGGNNVLEELTKFKEGITFLERLDILIEKCGDRCSEEMELSTPRWEEDPAFVLSMVAHYLQSDADPVKTIKEQKKKRLKARDTILKKMNVVERVLFTKVLEKTEQYIVMRENLKTTWAKGLSVLRVLYLVMAEKLVKEKMLEEKDDIFYLKRTEVTDIIKGKLEKKECENRIKERKKEKRLCQHIDVPEVVVGKPPPLEELQYTVERKDVLKGAGCSPGVVTGKARVVTNPRECLLCGEGDILVAPITDPGWSPFFVTAGGLVMELGGTLSHGIIIAREYGIPAVVGAKNATRLIKTGQIITVDGNTGVVSINSE